MPIIQMPGSALGHAGIAAAGAMQGEAQFRGQLANVMLNKQRFEQREALAEMQLQERRQRDTATQLDTVRRGMAQALNIGRDIGVDVDLSGYQAMDAELQRLDPESYEQIAQLYPVITDQNDPQFAPSYIARAKALQGIRETRGFQNNEAELQQLEGQAESLGIQPDELLGLTTRVSSDTPREFKARIDSVREEARTRIVEQQKIEHAKSAAQKILPDLLKNHDFEDEPELANLYSRLVTGESRNVTSDLKRLEIIANGGQSELDRIAAESFEAGSAIERQRAALKAMDDIAYKPFREMGVTDISIGGDQETPDEPARQPTTAAEVVARQKAMAIQLESQKQPTPQAQTKVSAQSRPKLFETFRPLVIDQNTASIADFAQGIKLDPNDTESFDAAIKRFLTVQRMQDERSSQRYGARIK